MSVPVDSKRVVSHSRVVNTIFTRREPVFQLSTSGEHVNDIGLGLSKVSRQQSSNFEKTKVQTRSFPKLQTF